MEPEEWVILAVAIGAIFSITILPPLLNFYDILQEKLMLFSHLAFDFIFSWKGLVILVILILPFILIINYNLNISLSNFLYQRKAKKERTEQERENIKKLLKADIMKLSLNGLIKFKKGLSKKRGMLYELKDLKEFDNALWEREKKCRALIRKLRKQKVLDKYHQERERLEKENEEIRKENERLRLEQENKIYRILNELDSDKKRVFFRDELSEEEIEALHEDDFEDANEYDVCEKRVIPVLVKRIMNHSRTHTFLVWSVQRLLEEIEGVEEIETYDTKNADITFKYKKGSFAIEIEIGSLLKKKKQLREKVKFLNRHFEDRWLFVVSNKNLLSQYRKLGPTTQRSEVEKTIKKWLNPDI